MKEHRIGIIMNGVTGRMGTNQHLIRSILAIRDQGGVAIGDDETIMPDPILVGRNESKLRELAEANNVANWTTDLDGVMSDDGYPVYFDALCTKLRFANVKKAIAAGKDVYVEKPIATTLDEAMQLYSLAEAAGVKHGVVQDKLWLPGLRKLKALIDEGFFGQILSARGDFGYWVFDGKRQECQRPSWNYRKEDGGSIMIDMFCHWRYLIDNLFGEIDSVVAHGSVDIDRRVDENGNEYTCTADDSAYGIFLLKNGVTLQFNSSWCTRVRRDDLLTIQIDGTKGSAIAGLRECRVQSDAMTPKPVWNPDIAQPIDFYENWELVPDKIQYDNAFKVQWEMFLKHIITGSPFQWGLLEGAKGVQLAELGLASWQKKAWVNVTNLNYEIDPVPEGSVIGGRSSFGADLYTKEEQARRLS
ncbi:MAG: Gfo/Idh/MocA family oxidoreductase [Planctomycetia bacterium]